MHLSFFPRFYIIFIIITLNSFSGRLPIFSSFSCPCRFLSCSFICNIFLCDLILPEFLCVWSPFCRLHDCSSSRFWCLPPGGWGWWRGLCRLSAGRGPRLPTDVWSQVLALRWAGLCQEVAVGSGSLGNLCADGWACVPNLLAVWPEDF